MPMLLRSSVMILVAVAASTTAFAQDDDELVPLVPMGKLKVKPQPRPKAKPSRVRPKPPPLAADDELVPIAPIAAKGDLLVRVASSLSGSILSIDGKEIGALPLPPQKLRSGEHTVSVKRPGYAVFVKKVQIPGGKTVEVEAKLTAVASVLSVTSDVPGAQVLLNGRSIGIAPLTDVEVPPGPAEVAVIKEGFREETQKINFVVGKEYPIVVKFNPVVAAGSDRPVSSKLTPTAGTQNPVTGVSVVAEPVTSKWYFWAGIAAAAAAVAIGVSVGVASQDPPLTDKSICGEMGCAGCIGLTCSSGAMGSF